MSVSETVSLLGEPPELEEPEEHDHVLLCARLRRQQYVGEVRIHAPYHHIYIQPYNACRPVFFLRLLSAAAVGNFMVMEC